MTVMALASQTSTEQPGSTMSEGVIGVPAGTKTLARVFSRGRFSAEQDDIFLLRCHPQMIGIYTAPVVTCVMDDKRGQRKVSIRQKVCQSMCDCRRQVLSFVSERAVAGKSASGRPQPTRRCFAYLRPETVRPRSRRPSGTEIGLPLEQSVVMHTATPARVHRAKTGGNATLGAHRELVPHGVVEPDADYVAAPFILANNYDFEIAELMVERGEAVLPAIKVPVFAGA